MENTAISRKIINSLELWNIYYLNALGNFNIENVAVFVKFTGFVVNWLGAKNSTSINLNLSLVFYLV